VVVEDEDEESEDDAGLEATDGEEAVSAAEDGEGPEE
jgi:hypothetical protein